MAPVLDGLYQVSCMNGYEGSLSADGLGITLCLYAYSHMSFSDIRDFAETCAEQFHLLRDYMLEHPEVQGYWRPSIKLECKIPLADCLSSGNLNS